MTTLTTWNCNMAFRKKKDQILRYDPDVLVVQECENPYLNHALQSGRFAGFEAPTTDILNTYVVRT